MTDLPRKLHAQEDQNDTDTNREFARLNTELRSLRLSRANLAAAARAAIAALQDHEPDPLFYLRDELTAQGFGDPTW
ncbi:hypothetical protein EDD29_7272 [Actinocorallia herbida]|uniref:Uncharacterized protein n=1 Tax=Actinocorallia herbida TaxID=58109 RepID=A0A3N1D7Q1_9ACTN|nr:hypothetical protein [Actinocorallia herbida]ROO89573.1 hypothetical protein EDD29_7272 [Actinocorallia herbida]